jgi:AcrR family transcriptional regulator
MASQRHTAPDHAPPDHAPPAPTPPDPLLRATRDCVLDVGVRRTTLAEVARRAGVSRMTAYRTCGDRDTLVNAMLTAELVGALERVTAATATLPTARERLVESAVRLVATIAGNPVYRRILELDPELLLPMVVDRFGSTQRAVIDAVTEQVRAGRRDGSVRRGLSASQMAEHLVVALQGFVLSARVLDHAPREVRALADGYLA